MTKKEVIEAAKVMEAYANGKKIQCNDNLLGIEEWVNTDNPSFNWDKYVYRIKPEPKYRPFKNQEECWKEMQKHQPFGWTKLIGETVYSLIVDVDDEIIYSDAFKECTFADGTPFGIKED